MGLCVMETPTGGRATRLLWRCIPSLNIYKLLVQASFDVLPYLTRYTIRLALRV